MKKTEDLVIAIDGHSSGGKSTFAKAIAKKLGLTHVDSGAMYRAVALYVLENELILGETVIEKEIVEHLEKINIEIRFNENVNRHETWLNGRNIEDEIRGVEVSKWASTVSAIAEVRRAMVDLQRKISENRGVVMDGRDIGTVVFPEADIKIFLTASADIRAERRHKEMIQKGLSASYDEVFKNIMLRDYQDSTRVASPLTHAGDAIDLDNSSMTIDEQMAWFEELLETRRKGLQ
ncbi:MAG: (d)CMP kinase [Bacteroidales bacterium]|nr:(d)CMP kinase [Bacteroidales bacterium]